MIEVNDYSVKETDNSIMICFDMTPEIKDLVDKDFFIVNGLHKGNLMVRFISKDIVFIDCKMNNLDRDVVLINGNAEDVSIMKEQV